MDWLHCNLCFCQPGNGKGYALTSCGHIYCEKCVKEGCEKRCKMCGAECTSMKLTSKLKPEVECFFMDPLDLAKKHNRELVQVMDFQRSHRKRLTSFIRERMVNQTSVIEKAQKAISQTHDNERVSGPGRTGLTSSPGGYKGTTCYPSPTRSPMSSYQTKMNSALHTMSLSQHSSTPVLSQTRLTARTPPSGGKMGLMNGTPTNTQVNLQQTPRSVPHPIQLSPMSSPMHAR